MKLIVAITHNEDAGALVDALLEKEFRATRLHSSGGFLKQSNATILLVVE
ncbi:MAG: cyclic-di-AMP receptor, partial [Candidatus Limnocylindrales bacterium]